MRVDVPDAPTGDNGVALYYPYLSIGDQGWLLGSLCLWDRVRRIVPRGLEVVDPAWMKPLVDQDMVGTSDTGRSVGDARGRLLAFLSPDVGSGELKRDRVLSLLCKQFPGFPAGESDLMKIFAAKADEDMWSLLFDAELAEWDGEGFIRVARPVGELYMSCLATSMASLNDTPLITDQCRYVDWSRRLGTGCGGVSGTSDPALEEVAALNLDWPDTGAFADCKVAEFCRFHTATSAARATMRDFLLGLRRKRLNARSPEHDADIVARSGNDFAAAYGEVSAKLGEIGVKRRAGVLGLFASVLRPLRLPEKLLGVGVARIERRTALSQLYKNPGYYAYLVQKRWLR